MYIYTLKFLCTGQNTIFRNCVFILFTVLITSIFLSAGEKLWLHRTINNFKNRRNLRSIFSFIAVKLILDDICYDLITTRRFQIVLLSFLERAQ